MKTFFIIIGIILLIAAAVMTYLGFKCRNQFRTLAGIVFAIIAFIIFSMSGSMSRGGSEMTRNLKRLNYICGVALGKYVKENYPGASVGALLRSDSSDEMIGGQKEIIKGFECGSGISVSVSTLEVAPRFNTPTKDAPVSSNLKEWERSLSADSFNAAFSGCGTDIVLNFAEFPHSQNEFDRISVLQSGKPTMILPQGCSQYLQQLEDPIRKGQIAALILPNMKAKKLSAKIPASEDEAFQQRFVMITPKNFDDLVKTEPYNAILLGPEAISGNEDANGED